MYMSLDTSDYMLCRTTAALLGMREEEDIPDVWYDNSERVYLRTRKTTDAEGSIAGYWEPTKYTHQAFRVLNKIPTDVHVSITRSQGQPSMWRVKIRKEVTVSIEGNKLGRVICDAVCLWFAKQ